jgi:PAS domain S-box-containing protein
LRSCSPDARPASPADEFRIPRVRCHARRHAVTLVLKAMLAGPPLTAFLSEPSPKKGTKRLYLAAKMPPKTNAGPEIAATNWQSWLSRSPFLRYAFAATSIAIALGLALLSRHHNFHNVEVPVFLFAVALTAWYAGSGPAALAVALSIVLFDFFFVEPVHSLNVTTNQIPYFIVFIGFALLVAWFSAVRRQVERELLLARDHLQIEVAERTQQASLLDLTHDSIFVRDMDFFITYWNKGAQELYGWSAEEALGKPSQELLRTEYRTPLEKIRAELVLTGRWEGELRRKTAAGTEVVVASRWSLRRDEQGLPTAILETSNDVTERNRREEEIETLNQELAGRSKELEATNKELEAFAYSVSHDLRAPLRHMAGYAELLQKRVSSLMDEKSHRYMAMILESAKRMGNLIDDLLAFSRIGRVETKKTQVNLEQLVKEAVSDLKQEASGRDIVWKIGALPICYGDRSMLRLVFINLLSNAVKFTRPRLRAEIEIGCAEGNEGEAVVYVKDNGAGFDMRYASKLFGVFQRLHQTDSFEGTGIGLATVQRIIHRHGGYVRAEGAVDQGATFYFSVPRA